MEQYEIELLEKHRLNDEELNALWEDHVRFEQELNKIESKPFLTPADELEIKRIKKVKLAGKTKIHQILDKYKQTEA